ncbi:MAG: hypothetical protein JNK82_30165 [Myxococcaceae bacterium]|nr:hypothetical protein [Myxococcaceae bacterium]
MSDQLTVVQTNDALRFLRRDSTLPRVVIDERLRDFSVAGANLATLETGTSRHFEAINWQRRPSDAGTYWYEMPWSPDGGTRLVGWAGSPSAPNPHHVMTLASGGIERLRFSSLLTQRDPLPLVDVERLTMAGAYVCATLRDGGVDCLLGAEFPNIALPAAALDVSMNQDEMCALLVTGRLYCWTQPNRTPIEVPVPSPVRAFALGAKHRCIVFGSNGVACMGSNRYGQLGHSGLDSPDVWVPVAIPEPIVDITSGPDAVSTCVRTTTQRAWCWGSNQEGQLGVPLLHSSSTPVRISQ